MRLYRNTIQTSESALQHRTNMTASFLLHFVMLVWSVVTAAEFQLVPQAGEYDMVSEKPGFKIRVSQFGLNYGANIAVDVLSAKVLQIKIPDQNGSAKVPVVRQVYYAISNSQVTSFNEPSTNVRVQPGSGLTWQLSNAGISIRGDWYIKYRLIFPVKSHGWFEGKVSGASLTVSVTLGAAPTGELTIRSTGCECKLSTIKIKLHGGASWFYNLFMKRVEKKLRNQLANLVCVEARKAIDVTASHELATLKTKVPVGSQLVLDYRLVSNPSFSSDYFDSFHLGEFFFIGDTSPAPFQPAPLPNPPTTQRMVTFWISDYVLNTAGYVLHKHGALHLAITKANLPPANKTLLDLTCCATCQCIGKMLPEAGKRYPGASVEIELATAAAPVAEIGAPYISFNFIGTARLNAWLTNGSLVYMLTLKINANSAATAQMNSTTLKFTMLSAAAKITVNDSAIGPVSVTLLNFVANYVIKHQVIPELNKAGSRGIPLPALDHIQLVNTDLLLQQNALCVSTDLRYIGDDFGNNRQTVDRHQESPMYFEVASELDENITGDLR